MVSLEDVMDQMRGEGNQVEEEHPRRQRSYGLVLSHILAVGRSHVHSGWTLAA